MEPIILIFVIVLPLWPKLIAGVLDQLVDQRLRSWSRKLILVSGVVVGQEWILIIVT